AGRVAGNFSAGGRVGALGARGAERRRAREGRSPRWVGVAREVVAAGAAVWQAEGDAVVRDLSLARGTELFERELADAPTIRRVAQLAAAADETEAALAAWRPLLAATEPATLPWFEARYESIRLLAQADPGRASEVLSQFMTLYPNLGPPPWRERFSEFAETLQLQPTVDAQGRAP
ncbi:MAG: hypothetical protein AAF747_05805, partial [Planctomycetota bacterium]